MRLRSILRISAGGPLEEALASPAVKEKLLAQGAIPGGNTPQEFAKMIDAEHIKWAGVVKASGAKVD